MWILCSAAVWGPPQPRLCVGARWPSACRACRDCVSAAEEEFEVTVRKPLGLTLVEGTGGSVVVEEVCGKSMFCYVALAAAS